MSEGIKKTGASTAAVAASDSPASQANWGCISTYRGLVYGILIAMVVLFHIGRDITPGTSFYTAIRIFRASNGTVDVFLFLSGVGLCFSWIKDNRTGYFWAKRVIRLLPSFVLICIPTFLWRQANVDGASFWMDFFNISFATQGYVQFWYIYTIAFFYALFPLFFKLVTPRSWEPSWRRPMRMVVTILVCMALVAILALVAPDFYDNTEKHWTRFPAFIAGCYAGQLVYRKEPIRRSTLWILLGLSFACWWISHFCWGPVHVYDWMLNRYWLGGFSIFLCIIFCIVCQRVGQPTQVKVFSWLGERSLEIFLGHMALRTILKEYGGSFFLLKAELPQVAYALALIATSLLLAAIVHALSKPFQKWATGLLNKWMPKDAG